MLSLLRHIIVLFVVSVCSQAVFAAQEIVRNPEIEAAITSYIESRVAGSDFKVRVRRIQISEVKIASGIPLDYEVIAPAAWEGWESANLSVIVRQGDRVLRNLPVRVEIDAEAEMVVAARQLLAGSIVMADDIVIKKGNLASTKGYYLKRVEEAVGKKLKVTARVNSPLRGDQLQKVPVVKPGQIVTVVMENGAMKLSLTGRAKGEGAPGDTIMVQNPASLKEFPAKILDANRVLVQF